jgi:hypothetical protein
MWEMRRRRICKLQIIKRVTWFDPHLRHQLVRLLVFIAAMTLVGCAPAPPPVQPSQTDATKEDWYGKSVDQLAGMDRQAGALLARGKADDAAAIITAGEPIADRLIAVRRPTLAAMEAASDLDNLYGRMLLMNRNYGWARIVFQKNLARWRTWKPQTDETARRLKLTEAAIAECDREMVK